MEKESNIGVCCDVSACAFNEKGCNCKKDTIKVTKGDTEKMHFCKSFVDKSEK